MVRRTPREHKFADLLKAGRRHQGDIARTVGFIRDLATSLIEIDPAPARKGILRHDETFETVTRKPTKRSRFPRVHIPEIGSMVFYRYQAKWADVLPFWDRYPMIFVIEVYKDGWLGLNLHYLPPVSRAFFMDALMTTANNDKFDETTKLAIDYQFLKGAANLAAFKPCIKRYLYHFVRTKVVKVPAEYWDMCMFLPTADWQVNEQKTVWKCSREILDDRGDGTSKTMSDLAKERRRNRHHAL